MSTGASASDTLHCWFLRISCNVRPLPEFAKYERSGLDIVDLIDSKHMKLFKNMHM